MVYTNETLSLCLFAGITLFSVICDYAGSSLEHILDYCQGNNLMLEDVMLH